MPKIPPPINRIWLRRFDQNGRRWMVLWDAASGLEYGSPARYPEELRDMLQQLNSLRAQHQEPMTKVVFADDLGPAEPPPDVPLR